jgi:hypothetical protein
MEFYSINPIREYFKIFSDEEKTVVEMHEEEVDQLYKEHNKNDKHLKKKHMFFLIFLVFKGFGIINKKNVETSKRWFCCSL